MTISWKFVVVTPPLLSLAVIVTGPVWSGPSVVANDQLHVPEFVPVLVTVPREAEMVTLLPAFASEYVPVFAAVWPSLTVTDALFAATVGAALADP